MNNYVVKYGETITDVALNSTGSILAWEAILQLNNLSEWIPELYAGQVLIVPDPIDLVFLNELKIYPACNLTEITNLEVQITDLTDLLDAVTPTIYDLPIIETINVNIYTVKQGETITDIVLNATGSILNWEAILIANNFTQWVPTLYPGQEIIIPDIELQTNILGFMKIYPACNSIAITDLDAQIAQLITNFSPPTKIFEDDNIFDFEDDINYKLENG
jgi:hypothetical protein